MVRFLPAVLTVVLCLSAAGETFRSSSLTPISPPEIRHVGTRTGEIDAASNGSSFLVVWTDDRQDLDSVLGGRAVIGQAMRIAADGTPMDVSSIGLPYSPIGVVWGGSDWVVLSGGALTRVSVDGEVLESRPFETGEEQSRIVDLAWTGDAFVVAVEAEEGGPLLALTFDLSFNLIRREELAREATRVLSLAGDGQSAVLTWIDTTRIEGAPDELRIAAAAFGRDGLLQKKEVILPRPHRSIGYSAMGTAGEGYVLAVRTGSASGSIQEMVRIERDLSTRLTSWIELPEGIEVIGATHDLAWDGARLTHYIATRTGDPTVATLVAVRISAQGQVTGLETAVGWYQSAVLEAAAGANGAVVLGFTTYGARLQAKARVFGGGDAGGELSLERGASPQDAPSAASAATHSLVAWRERISPARDYLLFAARLDARGAVADPVPLLLSNSACPRFGPAVATDGRDFLVVWYDPFEIAAAAIDADGSLRRTRAVLNLPGPCGPGNLALASNGTDYLLVWQEKLPKFQKRWEVYGLRLHADGTPIDTERFLILRVDDEASPFSILLASDGRDYLLATQGGEGVRITAAGQVLDAGRPISLLYSPRALWWNGRTYVIWAYSDPSGGDARFLRVGSDGSGGFSPTIPVTPLSPEMDPGFMPFGFACDAGGCSFPVERRQPDGLNTVSILRLDDDGTTVTPRLQAVTGSALQQYDGDRLPLSAGLVRVPGGPPVVLRHLQMLEPPYSGAHRVFVAPLGPPRTRAVRK